MSHSVVRSCLVVLAALFGLQAVAQQTWSPYEFRSGERFRYDLTWTQSGETSTGYYAIAIRPAGDGKLDVDVRGKLGEAECSARVTVESAEAVPQHMMTNCMMLMPAMMLFYGPAVGYYMGRELTDGDHWSFNQGEQSISFRVEGSCSHAGQSGKRAVMSQNGEVRMRVCVAHDLALPIAVMLKEDGDDVIQAKLVDYGR